MGSLNTTLVVDKCTTIGVIYVRRSTRFTSKFMIKNDKPQQAHDAVLKILLDREFALDEAARELNADPVRAAQALSAWLEQADKATFDILAGHSSLSHWPGALNSSSGNGLNNR